MEFDSLPSGYSFIQNMYIEATAIPVPFYVRLENGDLIPGIAMHAGFKDNITVIKEVILPKVVEAIIELDLNVVEVVVPAYNYMKIRPPDVGREGVRKWQR